ncbi:MAG: hypothetical protein CMN75_14610 [Spirochaeta sp.]|nr:hypothetical protein [Spirochaeta sp.]
MEGIHVAMFKHASRTASLAMISLLFLVGSASAEDFLKYQFTGTISALTDATAASAQRMTDAGMGIGAACVGTAYVDPNTVDDNPAANLSSYATDYLSFAIGDSAPLFEASGFERDSNIYLQQNVTVPQIPIPISGFGWAGSEPTDVSGPAFLAFNDQAESAPEAGDSKGHLLALGGFAALLTSVELPTAEADIAGLSLIRKLYIDVIDLDDGDSEFQIDCDLTTTSVTLEPLPVVAAVPFLSPGAMMGLMTLLAGTGLFVARGLRASDRR